MTPWKETREAEDWEAVAEALGVAGRQESNVKPVKSSRAWMPDDVFRPSFFPPVANQRSFSEEPKDPKAFGNEQEQKCWGAPKPTWCPICTEDMDSTDSSFVLCKCGFRLCLFCYHRILSEGGRCPNCRSLYNLEYALKLSSVVPTE